MAAPIAEIDKELDDRVEALGLEVVDVEWAGQDKAPILRIRIDLPDSEPGNGVTVQHCAKVSRALEPWLDEHPLVPERYTLEVSSPGVERPLIRKRDFLRFRGSEVAMKVRTPPEGRRSNRLEGVLEEVTEEGEASPERWEVMLRLRDGTTVGIPHREIVRANLVYRWDD